MKDKEFACIHDTESAFPFSVMERDGGGEYHGTRYSHGLTKREYMAAQIMGQMAWSFDNPTVAAGQAVAMTDALLTALGHAEELVDLDELK